MCYKIVKIFDFLQLIFKNALSPREGEFFVSANVLLQQVKFVPMMPHLNTVLGNSCKCWHCVDKTKGKQKFYTIDR